MNPTPPPDAYKPGTLLTVGSHEAKIIKYISEGGFAHVYTVEINPEENNSKIACLKRVAVPDKASLNTLRAEVDSMKRLSGNRHIVSYIDSHAARRANSDGYEVFVLMEYCENKGLIDFMNTRLQTRLTEHEVLRIMGEITQGVCNMHALSPPLVHRDIKIENVLISDNGDFKLCDFGSASPPLRPPKNSDEFSILQNDVLKNTTPQYRSPEMIDLYRNLPIDEKSDIWALGVFLYKLCYYTTPFEAKGELAILHASFEFPSKPVYSNRLKNLISVLLREDPRRRPNAYQTLEEIYKIRNLPVPLPDYTKIVQKRQYTPLPPIPKPQVSTTNTPSIPKITNQSPYSIRQTASNYEIQSPNNIKPVRSHTFGNSTVEKIDPFQDLRSSTKPPVALNIQNLNKSLGSLTLNNNYPSKQTVPPVSSLQNANPAISIKHKYVDSIVQTDEVSSDSALGPGPGPGPVTQKAKNPRSIKRPQSMYATSTTSATSITSNNGSSSNNSDLKRMISGLSAQTSTVELSPGENNYIDNNVQFLKSLQQQDSGKSWVQQTTGGSLKSLRKISTGSKKRNSLISQLTGKFSRSNSRTSSRSSSINESAGVYAHNTGSSTKFRSSSESIEEERIRDQINIKPIEPPKLKRSSSIQRRVQALLNKSNEPPIVRTAHGYGNDQVNNNKISENEIDEDGFKKPILIKKQPIPPPRKKNPPETPPSLSNQNTPSTLTKTPSSSYDTPIIKKIDNSPLIKKSAPPRKPLKPTHLKSNTPKLENKQNFQSLSRQETGQSELSISEVEDWEEKFNEKYPQAL